MIIGTRALAAGDGGGAMEASRPGAEILVRRQPGSKARRGGYMAASAARPHSSAAT